MKSNWGELNLELLHLISKKLENFSNFIRFRSVCKQWRLVVDPTDCPPILPWILHSVTPSSMQMTMTNNRLIIFTPPENNTKTDFNVYSMSSDSTSRIALPIIHQEYRYTVRRESTFGFLLLREDPLGTPYLYNPLTAKTFHLPFSAPHYVIYIGPDPNNSSTIKGGVHVVICQYLENESKIGFWKSQNSECFSFRIPVKSRAMGYYKEKLFVYSDISPRKTMAYEMTTGSELNMVIENEAVHFGFRYLVEAIGDLLGVAWSSRVVGGHRVVKCNVYQLEYTDDFGHCKWVKLNGIGDRMLFLTSDRANGYCLSSNSFNGLRGNCIYYLLDEQLVRYNMEDGTLDEMLKFPSWNVKWFMPSLS